tara:strand:+ start:3879 stop:4100 length:222 start_codon:yes stop_codon:yes gene_type:complete
MDWLAGITELFGSWCVGNKYKTGFIVNILASLSWIYVAITMEVYGLLVIAVFGVSINTRNYYLWYKDDILNNG